MGLFSKWKKVKDFSSEVEIVEMKNKSGLAFHKVGSKEVEAERYTEIEMVLKHTVDGDLKELWAVKKGSNYAFIDAKGVPMTGFAFTNFDKPKIGERYFPVEMDDKSGWALVDFDGGVNQYRFKTTPSNAVEGVRIVEVDDDRTSGETYFMEEKGYPMQHRFAHVEPFVNGMGKAQRKDGSYTFVTGEGEVLDISVLFANDFDVDGNACVKKEDKKFYLINKSGRFMDGAFDEITFDKVTGKRTGFIMHDGTTYSVEIVKGEVSFAEWEKFIETNPELVKYLPDNLFRQPNFVEGIENIVEAESEKLRKNANKLCTNKKCTQEDLDLARTYLDRRDHLKEIWKDKKTTAKVNNASEDKRIREEKSQRYREEAEKRQAQVEREEARRLAKEEKERKEREEKETKQKEREEARRLAKEEKERKEAEEREAKRLAKEAEDKRKQEIKEQQKALTKRSQDTKTK